MKKHWVKFNQKTIPSCATPPILTQKPNNTDQQMTQTHTFPPAHTHTHTLVSPCTHTHTQTHTHLFPPAHTHTHTHTFPLCNESHEKDQLWLMGEGGGRGGRGQRTGFS